MSKNASPRNCEQDDAAPKPDAPDWRRRADWIGELSRADGAELRTLWDALGLAPRYAAIRPPEIGLVMTRGRAGGEGEAFNLGEATATRCAVRLDSGEEGHAYALGRDKRKAEISALCDALMQTGARERVAETILKPLYETRRDRNETAARKAAATKVDFFTMSRGEDA